jgi:microcystin-dependent protein
MDYSEDYFVGQIVMWPTKQRMPEGFAVCDGRVLPIKDYVVLYSVIGLKFGGRMNETFALPDLRGRLPMGASAQYPLGTCADPRLGNAVPATPWVAGHEAMAVYTATPPSLELLFIICMTGLYPSADSWVYPGMIGEIAMSATDVIPGGFRECKGQTMPPSDYPSGTSALNVVIGRIYGTDKSGRVLTLPDLSGRFPRGTGSAPDIGVWPPLLLGESGGSQVMPLPDAVGADPSRISVPDTPPYFALKFLLVSEGDLPPFPSKHGLTGEIVLCAFRDTAKPDEWLPCDGRLLPISNAYAPLFTLIGNTFGGDGNKTFALPNLQGRIPMGATSLDSVGNKQGVAASKVIADASAQGSHAVWSPPYLGLQFLINTHGDYP